MREEWKEYYMFLEDLRESGITNMFGAAPYLVEMFGMSQENAREILSNWMQNYNEIAKKYYN